MNQAMSTTTKNPTFSYPQLSAREIATDLFGQKQTAMGYVHTQLRNISDYYFPRPDEELRKECEALGFIFHDNNTRDKKFLIKTTLPKDWYIQMPDTSNPRNCFWFRIMDQYGRARYEIYYNANPYPERHNATMKKLAPYHLETIHEYPIRNKHGEYLTPGGYRAVVLSSNDNFEEDLGFVCCNHRGTDEYTEFEVDAQELFSQKYATTFDEVTDCVRRPVSIVPNYSTSNLKRLLELINAGAVPRPDAETRIKCEKMGFIFHDNESFSDMNNIFEDAALYDPLLVRATLPEGWTITKSDNKENNSNLWFTVRDEKRRSRLHFYFVNVEQTPGLLHATMKILKPYRIMKERVWNGKKGFAWKDGSATFFSIVDSDGNDIMFIGAALDKIEGDYARHQEKAIRELSKYPTEFTE